MANVIEFVNKNKDRDNKIKKIEAKIEKMLQERPEYKQLLENIRKEVDRRAGKAHKMNRLAVSIELMFAKWGEIVPANGKLQAAVYGQEIADKVEDIHNKHLGLTDDR